MAICTITWAHNEEDILEYFVRHHCTFIDKMTIILHRSTDASYDILSDLIQEGLPIEIQENHTMHHAQSMFLTHALHQSANAYDWILPLDADEFLCSEGKDVQKELQCLRNDTLYAIPWKTYIPTMNDNASEPNPIKRITHRRAFEPRVFTKVFIPQIFAVNSTILPGNHGLTDVSDIPVASTQHPSLFLAHFPVRSAMQLRYKIVHGWEMDFKNPLRQQGQSFHWEMLLDRCSDPREITNKELTDIALRYALLPEDSTASAISDPLL